MPATHVVLCGPPLQGLAPQQHAECAACARAPQAPRRPRPRPARPLRARRTRRRLHTPRCRPRRPRAAASASAGSCRPTRCPARSRWAPPAPSPRATAPAPTARRGRRRRRRLRTPRPLHLRRSQWRVPAGSLHVAWASAARKRAGTAAAARHASSVGGAEGQRMCMGLAACERRQSACATAQRRLGRIMRTRRTALHAQGRRARPHARRQRCLALGTAGTRRVLCARRYTRMLCWRGWRSAGRPQRRPRLRRPWARRAWMRWQRRCRRCRTTPRSTCARGATPCCEGVGVPRSETMRGWGSGGWDAGRGQAYGLSAKQRTQGAAARPSGPTRRVLGPEVGAHSGCGPRAQAASQDSMAF